MNDARRPEVESFFDPETFTATHVAYDHVGGCCAIIDPVLDFDPKSGSTGEHSLRRLVSWVRSKDLTVEWILETHVHADHLSAAPRLRAELGGRIGIGAHVRDVQAIFGELFNAECSFRADGSQFDVLFDEGATFMIGELEAQVMHTPGHTPACVTYIVGDCAFVGDTLFAPDFGTARCDFPGGDAATLFRSAQRVLSLPAETRLFLCHDYPPASRGVLLETTVAAQRSENIHVHEGTSEADFVELRTARDATLSMPTLILPSVQVNMRAGELPPPEENGMRYLKIPLDAFASNEPDAAGTAR